MRQLIKTGPNLGSSVYHQLSMLKINFLKMSKLVHDMSVLTNVFLHFEKF